LTGQGLCRCDVCEAARTDEAQYSEKNFGHPTLHDVSSSREPARNSRRIRRFEPSG
jgi:hypothetical protein